MCGNTDAYRTDRFGDNCSWYDNNPTYCGQYDDSDFTAAERCCACTSRRYKRESRIVRCASLITTHTHVRPTQVEAGFSRRIVSSPTRCAVGAEVET